MASQTSAVQAPSAGSRLRRCTITVNGVAQGIGFRPFVYRLAVSQGVAGTVRNSRAGVVIEVEGDAESLGSFLAALAKEAPGAVSVAWAQPEGTTGFSIVSSSHHGGACFSPAPDSAICEACTAELMDAEDRRQGYPLQTCAVCGPRFSIVRTLPYDRERTTMSPFAPCDACRAEYHQPRDRRFHAETIACPECGPRVSLQNADGTIAFSVDPI